MYNNLCYRAKKDELTEEAKAAEEGDNVAPVDE